MARRQVNARQTLNLNHSGITGNLAFGSAEKISGIVQNQRNVKDEILAMRQRELINNEDPSMLESSQATGRLPNRIQNYLT